MKRTLSTLILALLLAASASAQYYGERVPLDLAPEVTAGKWYFTVIYNDPMTAADAKLYEFLHENPHIGRMRPAVVWNEYTTSRGIVRDTAWRAFLGGDQAQFPSLILQAQSAPDGVGRVVAFYRGDDLINNLDRLPVRLQIAIDVVTQKSIQQCPDGRCPYPVLPRVPLPRPAPVYPQPQPVTPATPPAVTPVVRPLIPMLIDPEAPVEPEDDGGIPLWYFALPVIGAGAGLWKAFEHSSK